MATIEGLNDEKILVVRYCSEKFYPENIPGDGPLAGFFAS